MLGCGQVGENRIASLAQPEEGGEQGDAVASSGAAAEPVMLVRDDGPFRHEASWRGAAVAVPVFSLRTRDSVGVGEFDDIRQLVDLCHAAGGGHMSTCRHLQITVPGGMPPVSTMEKCAVRRQLPVQG